MFIGKKKKVKVYKEKDNNLLPNLDSMLKIRDIPLPTEVCIIKAMVFPIVTYRCENWTIKKAEC